MSICTTAGDARADARARRRRGATVRVGELGVQVCRRRIAIRSGRIRRAGTSCSSRRARRRARRAAALLGQELVAFRTRGRHAPWSLDAHCPHMGAHVGYGGVVDGEGIRCPFHAWRFDADGPLRRRALRRRPPSAARRRSPCHPVHETSGLILVHHSDSGAAPTWHMPDLPEWGQPGWVGYETVGWRIRMHVQELVENVPDTAHFAVVHKVPGTPSAEIEIDGHIYRQRSLIGETGEAFTEQEAFGLGLVWLRTRGERHRVPHRDDPDRRGARRSAPAVPRQRRRGRDRALAGSSRR